MEKYNVTGMSCAACSARVEKAVSALPEVSQCNVNLLTGTMTVKGGKPQQIIDAVNAAGYGATLASEKKTEKVQDNQTKGLQVRLIFSVIVLAFLMYLSMGHMMWNWPLPKALEKNILAQGILQMMLSAVVMIINQRFFISGFSALWHRAPNMDTLVSLGSAAAFGYSSYALISMSFAVIAGQSEAAMHLMHELYFESAAMILTLITVGKMLESKAKGKTTDALKGLMNLAPETAVLLRDGKEITVPIEQVKTGDVFVVRSGERVAVDGVIIEGAAALDESALTGESISVDKTVGDTVSAATINKSGFMKCRATRVGEDTTLSQIIKLVSDASASKAPIAKIADKVSGVFVPIVLAIAMLTILGWLLIGESVGVAIARGISVLVISCPCALGLATPVAIMVGSGVGAKNGILFKSATALEQTGKVAAIVLDKTGTITSGQPEVTDMIFTEDYSEQQLLSLAYALEHKSEHPLARAIIRRAESENIALQQVIDFQTFAGNGLSAVFEAKLLVGGNLPFIQNYIEPPVALLEAAERLAEQGKTPIYFVYDSKPIGIIAVADVIKQDSAAAIKQLKKMGLRVIMLTGDHEKTARAIAAKAGIEEVIAQVLPDGKEREVAALCAKQPTVMVGDGINDAPALTRADIGIAIGTGTDIAIDAADVVLMQNSLMDVVTAIRLSRATLRNIKENLFWAFIYNLIGIPLAMGVFSTALGWQLSPMFGAAAMSLSSFCVVSNALRLNLFNPKHKIQQKTAEKEEKTMQKIFNVEGMMCPHCEARVKNALEALPQVVSVVASHTDKTVLVVLKEELDDKKILEVIANQGYNGYRK